MPTPVVKGAMAKEVVREMRKKPSLKAKIGAKALQEKFCVKEGYWKVNENTWEDFIS